MQHKQNSPLSGQWLKGTQQGSVQLEFSGNSVKLAIQGKEGWTEGFTNAQYGVLSRSRLHVIPKIGTRMTLVLQENCSLLHQSDLEELVLLFMLKAPK